MVRLLVIALCLVGCGEVTPSDVPEAFAADVGEFYALTGSHTPVIVRYGTLPVPYRGMCTITWEIRGAYKYWYRTITIDPAQEPPTPWRRKALIWHEMAHCVYRAEHVDNVESLMYPEDRSDLDPDALEAYWQASLYAQAHTLGQ